MRKNILILWLLIPLILFSFLFLILAIRFPLQGLYGNLFATLGGLIIAVFYVDMVIKKQKEKEWSSVKEMIYKRIEGECFYTISSVAEIFLDWTTEINTIKILENPPSFVLSISKNKLIPEIREQIWVMGNDKWDLLISTVDLLNARWDKVFSMFNPKMNKQIYSMTSDLYNKIEDVRQLFIFGGNYYFDDSKIQFSPEDNNAEKKQAFMDLLDDELTDLIRKNNILLEFVLK